jgi:hypothetical protein
MLKNVKLVKRSIEISLLLVHSAAVSDLEKYLYYFIIIIIIIMFLSWSRATCCPVPLQRIQKSLQRYVMISSASWEIVFHYPG